MKPIRPFELLIAWRYLGAQRKSLFVSLISVFSMLGVAIGTMALLLVLSAINGFEGEVTKQMMGKDAHFEVMKYHMEPIEDWEKVSAEIREAPEVTATAPFVVTKVGISSRQVNDGIALYGIVDSLSADVLALKEQVRWGEYSLDSMWAPGGVKRPAVILGVHLADRLRAKIGDPVVLQTFATPEVMGIESAAPRMVQCSVSGIFESGMYEYDASIAYVDLRVAQKLLGMGGGVTGIQGKVTDPWNAEVVAAAVAKKLGRPHYALDWKARNKNLIKWMSIEKILFGSVITLIIVVAAFNIISSLIMLVFEKTREIGILRAMGVSSKSVMKIFVMVGGFIGLIGSVLGCALGVGICLAQMKWGLIKLPPDVYMVSVFPVAVEWADVVAVFLVSNVICLLATVPPAVKASRMDPVGAIRHE